MIDGDNRTGFRQSITLNDGIAKLSPKLFQLRIDAGSTNDERPKLPSECRMNSSVAPPPHNHAWPALCGGRRRDFESAFDFVLECFENARNGHDHRNPL